MPYQTILRRRRFLAASRAAPAVPTSGLIARYLASMAAGPVAPQPDKGFLPTWAPVYGTEEAFEFGNATPPILADSYDANRPVVRFAETRFMTSGVAVPGGGDARTIILIGGHSIGPADSAYLGYGDLSTGLRGFGVGGWGGWLTAFGGGNVRAVAPLESSADFFWIAGTYNPDEGPTLDATTPGGSASEIVTLDTDVGALTIGAAAGVALDVYEVLVYDRVLTESQVTQFLAYIASEYSDLL
jgi:hypothetical protein